jgi:hypothetical protein
LHRDWTGRRKASRRVATSPPSDFPSSPKHLPKNVADMDGLIITSRTVIFLTCDQLTPRSRFSPENLTGPRLVKKFPTYYGIRRLITTFTEAATCSYPESNQSSPCPPSHFLKIHFNIILPFTPVSSKWSLSLGFPHKNPVCTSPPYELRAPPISLFFSCSRK